MAFAGRSNKIFKEGGAKPDAFEEHVASAIFDLQVQTDMKADLQDLFITSASEVDVGSRKAIIIHVPFRLLNQFHRIQQRLIRELEKKFSGKHVTIIAQRRILPREVMLAPFSLPP
jgi:small subunit ribosomal protein S7e